MFSGTEKKVHVCYQSVLGVLVACTAQPTPTPTPGPVVGRASRGDYVVEVWVSKVCAFDGDHVIVRGTVTNIGTRTHIIELGHQIVFDLIIADRTGVYRWSDGKPLTPELTRLELGPQESKTLEMQWTVVGGPGFEAATQLIDHLKYATTP